MARQAFFSDLVPALHHQASHRRQQLGRQQRHVVDHRLVLVTRLVIEIPVAQETTYRCVMVRQVVKTVEVAAQSLLQHPQHQNLPQVHSRTPDCAVGLRQNMLVEQRKQPLAQLLVAPYVLKPLQHRRDVVPRLRVDPDLLDGYLTELELRSVNFSHGVSVAKIVPKWVDPGEIPRKNTTPGRSSPLEIRNTPCRINNLRVFLQALVSVSQKTPVSGGDRCQFVAFWA